MKIPLDAIPESIRQLPVDPVRQMPVPFFVAWVEGLPEFRMADHAKYTLCVAKKWCWVCGQSLGSYAKGKPHPLLTFVVGPMCGTNLISSEPPSHLACARFSAQYCPFLSKPHMVRREGGFKEEGTAPAGFMIERNPGVTLLWSCRKYDLIGDGKGGKLFRMGEPVAVEWWAEGRAATRAEVEHSVQTGLPTLKQLCVTPGDFQALRHASKELERLYPRE